MEGPDFDLEDEILSFEAYFHSSNFQSFSLLLDSYSDYDDKCFCDSYSLDSFGTQTNILSVYSHPNDAYDNDDACSIDAQYSEYLEYLVHWKNASNLLLHKNATVSDNQKSYASFRFREDAHSLHAFDNGLSCDDDERQYVDLPLTQNAASSADTDLTNAWADNRGVWADIQTALAPLYDSSLPHSIITSSHTWEAHPAPIEATQVFAPSSLQ